MEKLATRVTVKTGIGSIRLGTATGRIQADGGFDIRWVRQWCLRDPAEVADLGIQLERAVFMHNNVLHKDQVFFHDRVYTWWPDWFDVTIVRPGAKEGEADPTPDSDYLYFRICERGFDPTAPDPLPVKAAGFWLSRTEAYNLADMLTWAAAGMPKQYALVLPRGMERTCVAGSGPLKSAVEPGVHGDRRVLEAIEPRLAPVDHSAICLWD